jgi:hypothetical protein
MADSITLQIGETVLPVAIQQGIPFLDAAVSVDGGQDQPIRAYIDLADDTPLVLLTGPDRLFAAPADSVAQHLGTGLSGDIDLRKVTVLAGSDFNTASGSFHLSGMSVAEGCKFNTASGDVKLGDCEVLGESRFSSASGDVELELDALPAGDLSAGSASGDVRLAVADFGANFTLVLIKRADHGRISCPFDYTREETFQDHDLYERKIVERGTGESVIELRTASGQVVVRD